MSGALDAIRYDSADYLGSVEDAVEYLAVALEEGGDDPQFITCALGVVARSGNLSALARKVAMSREGLHKALSPTGNPSFATVVKVAHALGLVVRFEAPSPPAAA